MIIKNENVERNEEHPQELKYWKSRVATKITSKNLKHMFFMWILSWIVSPWLNCQFFPNNFAFNFVILNYPILDLVFFVFISTSFDMNQTPLLSTLVCPIVLKSMLISMDLSNNYQALSYNQHKLILFIENIVKTRKLGNNMYHMSNLF